MKTYRIGAFISLLLSLMGPAGLILLYAQALIRPEGYASFIFQAGMAIYIIEFLSIHSSGMLFEENRNTKKSRNKRLFFLGFYAAFIFGFMLKLNCWFIGLYFFISLCAKVFMSQSVKDNINKSQMAFSCINLLLCTFIVVVLASFLKKVFPIPESITSQHIKGTSGLFVDTPQALLAWGILYFSSTIIFNVIMFFKHSQVELKA